MAQGKAVGNPQVAAEQSLRWRSWGLTLALAEACSQIVYKPREVDVPGLKLVSAIGATSLLLGVLASASWAQQAPCDRAPVISVYQIPDVTNATASVITHVRLSENAYIFVVAMDLDGLTRVLYPNSPGTSAKIAASKPFPLPDFFAGFGQGGYSSARYMGSRGSVIALASCAPLNLDRISSAGDWNINAIRGLIEARGPQAAMAGLATYLGAKGESIGRNFMWFGGGSGYVYARFR